MASQQQLIAELEQRLAERDAAHAARAAELEAEVRRLERELLGPKTERLKVPPADRDLGLTPSDEEIAQRREEAARKRRENALERASLPTEEVNHPVPEADKRCPKCNGTRFKPLGLETSTVFEYVPGRFIRRVHRREKVACSCGECILTAPPVPKLVAGGQYGFGFAAFLIIEKCADSIPIYRIEKRFQRLGIPMSRATINDILHNAAERAAPRRQFGRNPPRIATGERFLTIAALTHDTDEFRALPSAKPESLYVVGHLGGVPVIIEQHAGKTNVHTTPRRLADLKAVLDQRGMKT